jgi:hypothetical protein
LSFTDRIAAAGFTGWTAAGENVYAYAKSVFHGHAGFNVDWGVSGFGHRMNLMNFDQGGYVYTEVGVGIINENSPGSAVGPLVITEDFATRSAKFVVGVVYQDLDHDGFYSMGEGLPGVTISTSQGNYAVTSSSQAAARPPRPAPAARHRAARKAARSAPRRIMPSCSPERTSRSTSSPAPPAPTRATNLQTRIAYYGRPADPASGILGGSHGRRGQIAGRDHRGVRQLRHSFGATAG